MEVNNVIKAIIAVAVIVIVILFLLGFFNPLYEAIKGKDLTTQEAQMNNNNFDTLINNIALCQAQQDSECVCEGFAQFPGTFAIKSQLQITELAGRKAAINLTYKGKNYHGYIFENLKISAVYYDTKAEVPYKTQKTIDFSKEPPLFKQEGSKKGDLWWQEEMKVVSSMLYKKQDGIYFIIGYEQPKLQQFRKCGEKQT